MNALDELCKATGTQPDNWELIDGPKTRCGVDHWFQHTQSGRKAYVNDDQGRITVDYED